MTPPPTSAKAPTRRFICVCSRGGSVSSSPSDLPIRPIWLAAPVAVTSATPAPRTTSEPEKTRGVSSPPGRPPSPSPGRERTDFADGNGFARQQRFVDFEVFTLDEDSIGRDAIALGEHDPIAARHLAAGDPFSLAVADHQRAWAGQVAQGLENPLCAGFLNDGDDDRQVGEDQQDQRLTPVAERQIDETAGNQQREHRLAQDFEDDP